MMTIIVCVLQLCHHIMRLGQKELSMQ